MEPDSPWLWVVGFGVGGFGVGLGLVIGAFIARTLRRYMKEEGMRGGDDDRR